MHEKELLAYWRLTQALRTGDVAEIVDDLLTMADATDWQALRDAINKTIRDFPQMRAA